MRDAWLVRKTGAEAITKRTKRIYEFHDRATETYANWLAGYTEQEIVKITGLDIDSVEKDIAHIKSIMPTKSIIVQSNDRQRLLIQRAQEENYRNKLNEALTVPVGQYLAAGISPVAPLKEYRESVGMTEKSSGLNIQINQNQSIGGGVGRSEDIIRSVLNRIKDKEREKEEPNIIDVEPIPQEAIDSDQPE